MFNRCTNNYSARCFNEVSVGYYEDIWESYSSSYGRWGIRFQRKGENMTLESEPRVETKSKLGEIFHYWKVSGYLLWTSRGYWKSSRLPGWCQNIRNLFLGFGFIIRKWRWLYLHKHWIFCQISSFGICMCPVETLYFMSEEKRVRWKKKLS